MVASVELLVDVPAGGWTVLVLAGGAAMVAGTPESASSRSPGGFRSDKVPSPPTGSGGGGGGGGAGGDALASAPDAGDVMVRRW